MTNPPAAGQVWSVEHYERHAGFVPQLGQDVLALLAPEAGEHILDLGCGNGELTRDLAAQGVQVTGLEPDPSMAAAARDLGLNVLEQDAHDHFGTGQFHAVFSNAALHWMRDPETVIANAHTALRPGGRFVAEQGGFGNVAAMVAALRAAIVSRGDALPEIGPWDFPRPEQQKARLEAAGFNVTEIALIPRPTLLPTGIAGWFEMFAAPYLKHVSEQEHAEVIERALDHLPHLQDHDGNWWADYVRLRFAAVKPNA